PSACEQDVVALLRADAANDTDDAAAISRRGWRWLRNRCIVFVRPNQWLKPREMPAHPAGRVFRRNDERRRIREQPGGALPQPGDADGLAGKAAVVGDAGFARRHLRFATVAVARTDKRHARAEPGIVMNVDVDSNPRHAEAGDQVMDRRIMSK